MRSPRDQGPGWWRRQGTSWDPAGLAHAAALAERAMTLSCPTWALVSGLRCHSCPLGLPGGWRGEDVQGAGRGNTRVAWPPSPLQCLSDPAGSPETARYVLQAIPTPPARVRGRALVLGSGAAIRKQRCRRLFPGFQSSAFTREPVLQALQDAGPCPGSLEGRCTGRLPAVGCVCSSVYPGAGLGERQDGRAVKTSRPGARTDRTT